MGPLLVAAAMWIALAAVTQGLICLAKATYRNLP